MELGVTLSLIGVAVSTVGLVVALWQLNRTTKAVEASNEAASRAERDTALRQLIWSVPALVRIEEALESAVDSEDKNATRRELNAWRVQASEVSGLVSRRDDVTEELRSAVSSSITQTSIAKNTLFVGVTGVVEATQQARVEIGRATQGLAELSGKLKNHPSEESKNGR